nr:GntR family transcriptional regulator [Novosphingobium hassiacum]
MQVLKASQIVANDLKGRIARGEIKAGECLPPEPELMTQYDVSRPTLREAIRILETQGLITTTRGGRKGARVHYPSYEQAAEQAALALQLHGASLLDIMQLAAALTPTAARLAAERSPKPDLTTALRYYEDVPRGAGNPRHATLALHRLKAEICAMSGNEALRLIGGMMTMIVELQLEAVPKTAEDLPAENLEPWQKTYARIGEALRAIKTGAGAKAERLLRQSLDETVIYYQRIVAPDPLRFVPDWTRLTNA